MEMLMFTVLRALFACLWALFLLVGPVQADTTRTYFLAAEEVLWDYAPSYPVNPMHGETFGEAEKIFVEGNKKNRIGHQYYKARYVEYTDASFTRIKPRGAEWEHLGCWGQSFGPKWVTPFR